LPLEQYREVLSRAQELGFKRMFIQPKAFGPQDHLFPDFDRAEPFCWDKPSEER